jgi:hypothetical protein
VTTRRRPADATGTSRFGVYLAPEDHRALLKAAIDAGVSATALVEGLIRDHLRKVGASPARRRRARGKS